MAVPYTFGNATTSIPLSNLDTNFATAITLGNTAVYLGNTTTSFGNVTLTNLTISSVASTFPNSFLANSSVTINGSSVSLGGSVTITAASPGSLTIGTGLSGTSYNGSANVTIAIDSTVATLTGAQTLTNKTISGANNTLSNIGNGSLSNSSVTIGNTSVSLGGTATTLGNVTLTNVTISNVATTFPNSFLANSTSTLGNATITLGGTTTSVGNLTLTNATISSVSTPLTVAQGGTGLVTITANGLMTGNGTGNVTIISSGSSGNVLTSNGTAWLSTAPSAQVYPGAGIANSTGTAWGTSYTTTGTGTVVALATSPTFVTPLLGTPTSGTLTNTTGFPAANLAGTALPSAIVTSSLTALGTIATGVWNGTAIGIAYGGTGQATATAGFNALSPITTTGDLILGNGTNSATRLAIGANTYVLTSNGTTASWQASSGGGSGTVNSGTQYQLGYYATTGTAISGNSSIVTNASGNLGLGVTPSAWSGFKALEVGYLGSGINSTGVGQTNIFSNAYLNSGWKFAGTGSATLYQTLGSNGHNWYVSSASGTIGGNVTFTQVLGVGLGQTVALEGAVPQTGTGITFPATQSASSDANTLDDYEEGTWTATVTSNSGTATTYTTAGGKYTKVGRMVVVINQIVGTNGTVGTANSFVRITGLPFTAGTAGTGSGLNESNLNNGVSSTVVYDTTLDAIFVSGVTQNNGWRFSATYFV